MSADHDDTGDLRETWGELPCGLGVRLGSACGNVYRGTNTNERCLYQATRKYLRGGE